MRVTHLEHQDTHTVFGGSAVKSFGISDNAEFITMLSEGLYSNKNMAVIREIMCNAYDAHVAVGREDVPIRITLTGEKLTISDSGPGIHDNVIESIYCVYGNSTKVKSQNQNGGFGLGSKAPFAYSHHFTVISQHAGVKTIYAVSRGSVETNGKPDMRTMTTLPTTQTGLEVSIPLRSTEDSFEFESLIRQIAYFGEMNVELNGEKLEVMKFSEAKHGFVVLKRDAHPITNSYSFNQSIYIRYCNVIYPLTKDGAYASEWEAISELTDISSYATRVIILQAPPDSISVTPSRESLSMTKQTVSTVTRLLTNMVQKLKKVSIPAFSELVEFYALGYISSSNPRKLINMLMSDDFNTRPDFVKELTDANLTTPDELIRMLLMYKNLHNKKNSEYYISPAIRKNILFNTLSKHDRSNVYRYRLLRKVGRQSENIYQNHSQYMRVWNEITLREIREILGDHEEFIRICTPSHNGYKLNTLLSFDYSKFMDDYFHDSTITFGYNQRDIIEGLPSVESNYYERTFSGFFVVQCSRKKGLAEKIVEKFEKSKFHVEDCLYESEPKAKPLTKRPKGYVLLSSSLNDNGNYRSSFSRDDVKRLEHPKVAIYERTKNHQPILDGLNSLNLESITILVPDAVVVSSYRTFVSLRKKGVISLHDALLRKMLLAPKTDSSFLSLVKDKQENASPLIQTLSRIAEFDPKLKAKFDTNKVKNRYSQALFQIYCDYQRRLWDYSHDITRVIRNIETLAKKYVQPDPFLDSLETNSLVTCLNLSKILASCQEKKPEVQDQLSLLHYALEHG